MKTINDEVFGQMTYDYQWERVVEESLWGRSYELSLSVESETDDDDAVSPVQRKAYKDFSDQHAALEPEILKMLVHYCQDELGVSDCTEDEFLSHNTPKSIFFPLSGEWVIMFDSDYDEEEGLAAVVRDGQIEVGSQDIIL